MTLEEIALSIDSDLSLNKMYRVTSTKHPWISALLMEAYEALCGKIKFRSDTNEYLSYDNAAKVLDSIVLTISMIYDRKIAELEHAN